MNQTYSNKELVIVHQTTDEGTVKIVEKYSSERIVGVKYLKADNISLGNLRNLAIANCSGDYFTPWDDDDWHHPRRLEIQMNAIKLSKKPAAVLDRWIMFDSAQGKAYMSRTGPWAPSVLCETSFVRNGQLLYPDINKHEDFQFLSKLIAKNAVFPVLMPSLYIYIFHGSNTCSHSHFRSLFSSSMMLSDKASNQIKQIIGAGVASGSSEFMLSNDMLSEFNYFHQARPRKRELILAIAWTFADLVKAVFLSVRDCFVNVFNKR